MVKKQTTLQVFQKSSLVMLVLAALLTACAPNPAQVQSLVQTSVASTMQAQNQVSTFVAQTVEAQQPAATATVADTATAEVTASPFPTLTPVGVISTFTPAPVSSGGGGGGGGSVAPLAYACGQEDWRPLDYSVMFAGEHFDVKWTLENTGTQQWCESQSCAGGPDLTYVPGSPTNTNNFIASSFGNGPVEVLPLKPGKTQSFGPFTGIAPSKRGTWFMVWKLEDMQNSECLQFVIVVK
ncbi:MAG TPA: NBR1-Ig-like domain-containing protein [Anaerolineales bacterium]|nr:NBR1-Ig-like domain-containing protein [Anaerolineales bacterium]